MAFGTGVGSATSCGIGVHDGSGVGLGVGDGDGVVTGVGGGVSGRPVIAATAPDGVPVAAAASRPLTTTPASATAAIATREIGLGRRVVVDTDGIEVRPLEGLGGLGGLGGGR